MEKGLTSENFSPSTTPPVSFSRISINQYGFYICRQNYIDINGKEEEIAAVLTINLSIIYNGYSITKILINFVSIGAIKKKYALINNNTLQLEMLEKDLIVWQMGLKEKVIYLDLTIFEDNYLKLYLSSANK